MFLIIRVMQEVSQQPYYSPTDLFSLELYRGPRLEYGILARARTSQDAVFAQKPDRVGTF